jgi:predicted LPLAT superfamily acyltransferase
MSSDLYSIDGNGTVAEMEQVIEKYVQRVCDAKDSDGRTALTIAAREGNIALVKALLMHHASVDLQDKWGRTALIIASQEGHLGVVNALLTHHASVDLQAKDGRTALIIASQKGHLGVYHKSIWIWVETQPRHFFCLLGFFSIPPNVVPLLLGVMRSLITEARRFRGIGRCN